MKVSDKHWPQALFFVWHILIQNNQKCQKLAACAFVVWLTLI